MVELSNYIPINFICLVALGLLGLRKLVLMDGHHEVRVAVLTCLLWVPTIYLVLLFVPTMPPCDHLTFDEGNVFACSEM